MRFFLHEPHHSPTLRRIATVASPDAAAAARPTMVLPLRPNAKLSFGFGFGFGFGFISLHLAFGRTARVRVASCHCHYQGHPKGVALVVAGVTGLEPAASCVTGRRSNQLSYTPVREPTAMSNKLLAVSCHNRTVRLRSYRSFAGHCLAQVDRAASGGSATRSPIGAKRGGR